MSNIGEETRATQIAKWRDAVHKNADLLAAFEMKPTDDDLLAKFRADVSARIKDLADYLANGEWGLFLGTELREPPSKEEREAQAEEYAAQAEAEANAAAAGEIVEAVSTSPLALPKPKCVHWDETKNECGNTCNPCAKTYCDGRCRECAHFSLGEETIGGIPKSAFEEAKADIKRRKKSAKKSGTSKKTAKGKKPGNKKGGK